MKKTLLAIISALMLTTQGYAQETSYHLPKTAVRVSLLIEKTSYKPGDMSAYSGRFLKKKVGQEATESYRLIDIQLTPYAIPDTAHIYTAHIDNKRNIQQFNLSKDNILLSINADAPKVNPFTEFRSAPKTAVQDPYKHLSQEILAAGSRMKMAELCAQEIYDIRESRNELTRGQAEYMPKDGEQLRIMLNNLDNQENAIRQLFEGVTTCDTLQRVLTFVPEKDMKSVPLFRFSKHFGVVAADDLSGELYYMEVEDLKTMPNHIVEPGKKAPKDETGIWIVLPGKIRLSVTDGLRQIATSELSAAQFGEVENLNDPLFSKKVMTRLVLHPVNGGIDSIESTPVK